MSDPIAALRMAYADPPYLGCCGLYDHEHGDDGRCWDDPETHRQLVDRLVDEYPDGWALSLSAPSRRVIDPMTPLDTRMGVWVKTFVAFKKGVRPCYAWEPVIFWRGRNPRRFPHAPPARGGKQNTPKDFLVVEDSLVLAEPITLRKGLTGAKPEAFCSWVLDLLNVQEGDDFTDIYPGTGVMGKVAATVTNPDKTGDEKMSHEASAARQMLVFDADAWRRAGGDVGDNRVFWKVCTVIETYYGNQEDCDFLAKVQWPDGRVTSDHFVSMMREVGHASLA